MAFWCTGAAILGLAPLVPLGTVILSGGGRSVSTSGLAAFAAYALVIAVVGGYPFEKIRQLGASAGVRPAGIGTAAPAHPPGWCG